MKKTILLLMACAFGGVISAQTTTPKKQTQIKQVNKQAIELKKSAVTVSPVKPKKTQVLREEKPARKESDAKLEKQTK